MPVETKLFMNIPLSDIKCPRCGVSSNGFMRGYVQRSRRFAYVLWSRPYCAIICHVCKDVIGWESPTEAVCKVKDIDLSDLANFPPPPDSDAKWLALLRSSR